MQIVSKNNNSLKINIMNTRSQSGFTLVEIMIV
ncbi:MAG: prepilin-type N-terminal cleavage/methylation domain-containing protein, partial [Opitutaceae bacterium]|nr:prepilin-type N-terminal cleavage/methylation domain-containing protein [Opitutaceae bacterium]